MFRHSQWVKFAGDFDRAHHSPDGRVVGIVQHRKEGKLVVDVSVHVVTPDGRDLELIPGQSLVLPLPSDAVAITDRNDLPPGRFFQVGWTPKK